jgi:hypothetical protein
MCNVDGKIKVTFEDGEREVEPDYWVREESFLGNAPSRLVPALKGYRILEGMDGSYLAVKVNL